MEKIQVSQNSTEQNNQSSGHDSTMKQSEQKETTTFSNGFNMKAASFAVNGQLVDNVEVLDHITELLEREHTIVVSITLNNGTVDQLLKLYVSKVSTHHHFKYSEKLSVRNESIVVHVIDLESKTELLLTGCASGQRVKTMYELEEGNATILVLI